MSDRQYRQRGYQDTGRSQGEREKSRPRSEADRPPREMRAPNMPGFHQVMRCARCGQTLTTAVANDTRCTRCGADLHACAMCESFDTGSRFECTQTIAARISPKDVRNECTLFEARITIERQTGSTAPASARSAFDDLFK